MKFTIRPDDTLKTKVENMTVRQLLMAVSCPQTTADAPALEEGFATVFLHGTTLEKAKKFHRQAENLLICTDTECGAGMMLEGCTDFPSMGALGVCDDAEIAYQVGRITARESRQAGFCWSLSPCVDIRLSDKTPTVSIRAAGDTAAQVMKIAGAYMEGLQDGGVAATIKHFPGDGATDYDQHLTTTVNPLSKEDWWATYGKVYADLIARGAMCVMPGHISLPAMDEEDPVMGLCPPATLSKPLMTDLLKSELGFEGLICSDALSMSGFCGFMNYYEACAIFLKNGGDVLLFAQKNELFYEKMTVLVENGTLPLEILRDRAYRVLCFCKQCKELPVAEDPLPQPEALSKKVVEKAIKIQRDRFGYLPFAANENIRILLTDISSEYTGSSCHQALYEELQRAGYGVELLENPGPVALRKAAQSGEYDLILCSVANGYAYGTNVLRLYGRVARNMMEGWTKLGTPVVFLCFHDISFHNQFAAPADAVVYTHGVTEYTHKALIEKLFQ